MSTEATQGNVTPQYNNVQLEAGKHYRDETSQPRTEQDFLDLIRAGHADLLRDKQRLKDRKSDLKEAEKDLPSYDRLKELSDEISTVRAEFKAEKLEDEDVENAQYDVDAAIELVGLRKQVLSDLLVVYGAKFNKRTVSLQRGKQNMVLYTAIIGEESAEQLSLF